MGEQNRRTVDLDAAPNIDAPPRTARPGVAPERPADTADRALSPEADERQTARQAPSTAAPGESAQDDSIG